MKTSYMSDRNNGIPNRNKTGFPRPTDKSVQLKIIFSDFSTKTYVVGTQKNRLDETVLLSTQNTCSN